MTDPIESLELSLEAKLSRAEQLDSHDLLPGLDDLDDPGIQEQLDKMGRAMAAETVLAESMARTLLRKYCFGSGREGVWKPIGPWVHKLPEFSLAVDYLTAFCGFSVDHSGNLVDEKVNVPR